VASVQTQWTPLQRAVVGTTSGAPATDGTFIGAMMGVNIRYADDGAYLIADF
jgi:hypothetical protein